VHVDRYRQIITVLARYGIGPSTISRARKKEPEKQEAKGGMTTGRRLRLAFAELGPVFIKIGQLMSTRHDLFSEDVLSELSHLDEDVAYLPTELMKEVVQQELGRPVEEIFDSFDDTPIAAASLAQVHRATLDGHEVVLKIQRPDIRKLMETDLEIIQSVFRFLARHIEQFRLLNVVGIIDEFTEDIERELDFALEVKSMEQFAANFADYRYLRVPKVYDEFSTSRLIVMEDLHGIHINRREKLIEAGYDPQLIVMHGASIMLRSMLEFGFFYADPHPGNLVVLPGNCIGIYDFGMMGVLPDRMRERMIRFIAAISSRDQKRIARSVSEVLRTEGLIRHDVLEGEVAWILHRNIVAGNKTEFGGLLLDFVRMANRHGVPFQKDFFWLAKTMIAIGDIARDLNVDLDVVDFAHTFVYRSFIDMLNPVKQINGIIDWISQLIGFLDDFPREMHSFMRRLSTGSEQFRIRHLGFEEIIRTAKSTTTIIALVLLTFGLLISSSIIILSRLPPLVFGIPAIGLGGLALGGALFLTSMIVIVLRRK
jgi:ubiquinone biosynthesis protein